MHQYYHYCIKNKTEIVNMYCIIFCYPLAKRRDSQGDCNIARIKAERDGTKCK